MTRDVDEELFSHSSDERPTSWLIGLLSDALGHKHVDAVMTEDVATTAESSSLVQASATMLKNHVHRLPVVASSGQLLGIVSTTDILKAMVDQHADSHRSTRRT